MTDPRDERIATLEAENDRLDRAWRSKHERCVASEKEAGLQFERAAAFASENARLRDIVQECTIQIAYLHEKFAETGTGNAVLARARAAVGLKPLPSPTVTAEGN